MIGSNALFPSVGTGTSSSSVVGLLVGDIVGSLVGRFVGDLVGDLEGAFGSTHRLSSHLPDKHVASVKQYSLICK